MGLLWTLTGIAVLVVAARLSVRRKMKVLSSDDWIMLLAVVFQIVAMSFVTNAYTHGLGKHDADLSFDNMVEVLKWSWLNMIPGTLVAVLARVSSAIFLNRIFGAHGWFRWFLIIFTSIQCIGGVLVLLTNFLGVQPVAALWNPTVLPTSQMNPEVAADTAYVVQALFTFADLTYVLFPVIIIWRLNMPIQRRIGLALLMCTSLVTMAVSILKTTGTQTVSSNTKEPQYTASLAVIYVNVEQTLVIIMASAPTLRAIKNVDFGVFSRLGSSLASHLGYSSRKSSQAPSVAHYHDLEKNTHQLGRLHVRENSIAVNKEWSSQSLVTETVPEDAVRRTDHFSVSYGNHV